MERKIIKITETELKEIVANSANQILGEGCLAQSQYPDVHEMITEKARINTKEAQGSIFPYQDYDVRIWSNDHEPAHFHIVTEDWDVSFLIADGSLYKVNAEGKKKKTLSYMCNKVVKWLNSPCAVLPVITNQQNAQLQWIQLHPPKE